MKPTPTDIPDFEQVRELLRAQYAELGPKRPGWIGRLAQRFQPSEADSAWVEHAAPELSGPTASAENQIESPAPQPRSRATQACAPSPDQLPFAYQRLSRLAAAFSTLAEQDLADLIESA